MDPTVPEWELREDARLVRRTRVSPRGSSKMQTSTAAKPLDAVARAGLSATAEAGAPTEESSPEEEVVEEARRWRVRWARRRLGDGEGLAMAV
jgi:hypothetical protein